MQETQKRSDTPFRILCGLPVKGCQRTPISNTRPRRSSDLLGPQRVATLKAETSLSPTTSYVLASPPFLLLALHHLPSRTQFQLTHDLVDIPLLWQNTADLSGAI